MGLSPHGRGNQSFCSGTSSVSRSIPARAGEPGGGTSSPRLVRVYPRTGGGTGNAGNVADLLQGLSPHGRGNHAIQLWSVGWQRSIPARAGEPPTTSSPHPERGVYPRTGGGTMSFCRFTAFPKGLSPHGRGNRPRLPAGQDVVRSIPARAGEPRAVLRGARQERVYPRTGGGTDMTPRDWPLDAGLSPHGRGNPTSALSDHVKSGSIPARAGEPALVPGIALDQRVYPRTGGGTSNRDLTMRLAWGLSPHGRGNPGPVSSAGRRAGSIPARAGEPPRGSSPAPGAAVYPRTGGGTGSGYTSPPTVAGLSPHGRGNRQDLTVTIGRTGSIPARAGEPLAALIDAAVKAVYPRTGGGTFDTNAQSFYSKGLSPHGRGNHVCGLVLSLRPGSIPARAGEP